MRLARLQRQSLVPMAIRTVTSGRTRLGRTLTAHGASIPLASGTEKHGASIPLASGTENESGRLVPSSYRRRLLRNQKINKQLSFFSYVFVAFSLVCNWVIVESPISDEALLRFLRGLVEERFEPTTDASNYPVRFNFYFYYYKFKRRILRQGS